MNPSQWTADLFYSTSVPSPAAPAAVSENSPSPAIRPRLSASTPHVARADRRRPLSDLKERPEGLIYHDQQVVRRLRFDG